MIALPVYLVVDTSGSLTGDIDAINQGLADLFSSLLLEPRVAGTVRIALIQFSSEAREVVPLTDIHNVDTMPNLQAQGSTDYGAAFSLVRQLISRDVAELQAAGVRVFRPVMFFITDGSPVDLSWQTTLRELQSPEFRERPTIIAIGFGTADPSILREVGSGKGSAFMISDTISIRDAVGSISSGLTSMLRSTVHSTVLKSGDTLSVPLPDEWLDLSSIPDVS